MEYRWKECVIDRTASDVCIDRFISSKTEFRYEPAMGSRPMLYAICIWGVASLLSEKMQERKLSKDTEEARDGDTKETDSATLRKQQEQTDRIDERYCRLIESGLTKREAEVALLMCKGCSNREIAAELTISETTVKKHVSNIFEKTGIVRREEIIKLVKPNDL